MSFEKLQKYCSCVNGRVFVEIVPFGVDIGRPCLQRFTLLCMTSLECDHSAWGAVSTKVDLSFTGFLWCCKP
eukprot:3588618-Amphidinium_carterae.1